MKEGSTTKITSMVKPSRPRLCFTANIKVSYHLHTQLKNQEWEIAHRILDTYIYNFHFPKHWPIILDFLSRAELQFLSLWLMRPTWRWCCFMISFYVSWIEEADDLKWKKVMASIGVTIKHLLFLGNVSFLFSGESLVPNKLFFYSCKVKPQYRILNRGIELYDLSYVLEYHAEYWLEIDYKKKG